MSTDDKFEKMWNQQEEFMKLLVKSRGFPQFPVDVTTKESQQFIDGIIHHTMKELFEAGQHLKNSKAHRATENKEFHREEYKVELADALHLLYEICIVSGITQDELYEAYMKKGETNVDRIKNGY